MGIMLGTCKACGYSIKATISIIPPSTTMILSTLLLSRSSTRNSLGFCNCFCISSFLLTQRGFLFCYQNPDVTRSHNKKKAGEKRKMPFKRTTSSLIRLDFLYGSAQNLWSISSLFRSFLPRKTPFNVYSPSKSFFS